MLVTEFVVKCLEFGVLGLCAVTLFLVWKVLQKEQNRKGAPRAGILRASYAFMGFAFGLAGLNAYVQLNDRVGSEDDKSLVPTSEFTAPVEVLTPSESIRLLWDGIPPRYAVRLVPGESVQDLDRTLAREDVQVAIVGDYSEVAGLPLGEACEKFGMWPSACSVTVFEVSPNGGELQLRPASSRGALKIADEWGYLSAGVAGTLRGFDSHGATGNALSSWATEGGLDAYWMAFEELPAEFFAKLSELNKDWNPLGFTVSGGSHTASIPSDLGPEAQTFLDEIGLTDAYGARCFFVRNIPRERLLVEVTWWIEDPSEILPARPF